MAFDFKDKKVVLLLQGGGALGAYQVGAYRALAERCKKINWVAGISIGAFNASVIAAHRDGDAVQGLCDLWNDILLSPLPPFDFNGLWKLVPTNSWLQQLEPKYLGWGSMALPFGLPNFFTSRVVNPLLNPWVMQWFRPLDRNELAFYDTTPMRATLRRHVDFSKLGMRLSLGVTRVTDGEVVFFDSQESASGDCILQKVDFTVDHTLASGALPPAFPPSEIGGVWYFDGGVSSNTPIEALQYEFECGMEDTIVFIIDIWDRKRKELPRSLEDVLWRQKSIQYGSRKKAAETVVNDYEQKGQLNPGKLKLLEVCQVMYETDDSEKQFSFSDADFSRATFNKLSEQGYEDMASALKGVQPVIDGKYSKLYRVGSLDKHAETDVKLVERYQTRRKKEPAGAKRDFATP
ncbi:MAG: patatin-like phospholipase family protein [Candidatus Korobacteraceae bacterium]